MLWHNGNKWFSKRLPIYRLDLFGEEIKHNHCKVGQSRKSIYMQRAWGSSSYSQLQTVHKNKVFKTLDRHSFTAPQLLTPLAAEAAATGIHIPWPQQYLNLPLLLMGKVTWKHNLIKLLCKHPVTVGDCPHYTSAGFKQEVKGWYNASSPPVKCSLKSDPHLDQS